MKKNTKKNRIIDLVISILELVGNAFKDTEEEEKTKDCLG